MYLRKRIWLAYLVLFTLVIPWYWPSDILFNFYGFPIWVIVSLFFTLLTALFTTYLLSQPWDESFPE